MATVESSRKKKKDRQKRRAQRAKQRAEATSVNGKKKDAVPKKQKSKVREWVDALFFAVVVMIIVRSLFFDLFRIPTPSMEKSLMVGDYLFVSKVHYGTRLPMKICVPFTDLCVPGITFPYTRLPGFSSVQRGDAIVFNWPADPVTESISRKQHYIKRVVGLPGETVAVVDKVVHVNGEALPLMATMQQLWDVYKKDQRVRLSEARLSMLGITQTGLDPVNPSVQWIIATPEAVEELRTWSYIERVEPHIEQRFSRPLYPASQAYTTDNYGPVTIPQREQTVPFTPESWQYYEPVIRLYEGHTTGVRDDGTFEIDGQAVTTYTFVQDYYFVMGDNRDNSEDGRFWGFVPMDHVVGKAVMIYFSWDEAGSPFFVGQIRFGRMFSLIR